MPAHVLRFDSAGVGHCLFTEMMDLNTIGRLEITRATNIEFNNATQEWEVKDIHLDEPTLKADHRVL